MTATKRLLLLFGVITRRANITKITAAMRVLIRVFLESLSGFRRGFFRDGSVEFHRAPIRGGERLGSD